VPREWTHAAARRTPQLRHRPLPHRVRPNAGRHPRRRGTARRVHRRSAPVLRGSAPPPLPRDRRRPAPSHRRPFYGWAVRDEPAPVEDLRKLLKACEEPDSRQWRDTALIRRMPEPGGMHHARTKAGCSGHRTRRTAGTPWPCLPTQDEPRSSRPYLGTCRRYGVWVFQPLTRAQVRQLAGIGARIATALSRTLEVGARDIREV